MTQLKHCLSVDDFSHELVTALLDRAEEFEAKHQQPNILKDLVVASLFFEPSTRTRLSFESATKYLGGSVIGFASGTTSSTKKGESLEDTIKTVVSYCDAIVIRHPDVGSARAAAAVSSVPVINAGDGSNEHPTQTLLDLYAIRRTQGSLDGLKVGFAGDLKHSRTMHSLIKALSTYKTTFVLIAPEQIQLGNEYLKLLKAAGCTYEQRDDLSQLEDLDILYTNRVQQERFSDPKVFEKVKDSLVLTPDHLTNIKPNLKVLNPLPRVNELSPELDNHPAAYYFEQVRGGLFARQALLESLLT